MTKRMGTLSGPGWGIGFVVAVTCCFVVSCSLTAGDCLAASPKRSESGSASDYGIRQVKFINEQVRQQWKDSKITPSVAATDGEWCRRVYLDILGRIPSVKELKEFHSSNDPEKKSKLVSKLLYDESYVEDYARNWTTIWTTILIGRAGGTEQDSLTSRSGMQKYLRDTFARNKPYNDMVLELVTATGANEPGSENFNGAVNFLVMKVNDENASLATAATAKTLLGLQIQCTQCHNHPFNDWKQQKFWEMNAFFRQTKALRKFVDGSRQIESAELVNQDYGGEGRDPTNAEIYYEIRNAELKVAYPVFVDGTEIGRSGYVQEINRRQELGKLMMQSTFLDKMVVNRYWSHFLGYGFTKPIDDMGPHNTPSHPELLEYLGQEVRKNSYNLKEVIRWIALSEAYSLSSRTNSSNEKIDDPLIGEIPKFSRFYLRQMQAEQLYESLLVATEAHRARGSYEEQEKLKADWLAQFVTAFGNDEGEELTTFNGTIPQALMMFNGDLIQKAISLDKGSFLSEIANSNLKPQEKIGYLFQAGMSRNATKREIEIANQLLLVRARDKETDAQKATVAALQDVFWAVLNSNEFIIIH